MNTNSASNDSLNDDMSIISAHTPQDSTFLSNSSFVTLVTLSNNLSASEQDYEQFQVVPQELSNNPALPPTRSAVRGILASIWSTRSQDKQAQTSIGTQSENHASSMVTGSGSSPRNTDLQKTGVDSEQRMGPSTGKTLMQTDRNGENGQHSGQAHSFFGRLASKLDPFAAVNALFHRGETYLFGSNVELDPSQREQLLRDFQGRLQASLVDIDRISSKDGQAQKLVDLLQAVLDSSDAPSPSLRQTVLLFMQQLVRASGHYPSAYSVKIKISNEDFQASGALGDVYRIRHKGHTVRVKRIAPVNSSRDQLQALQKIFAKECLSWGQLHHPNVLPFYGFCEGTIWPSVASPWTDNGDINQYLKESPRANRHLLSMDVAVGLEYLHVEGVVHGDLKGSNVLVDVSGRARIADYGITPVLDSNSPNWATHLPTTTADEMYRWRAPELLGIGNKKDIHNTKEGDVYAWACVCYQIFVGDVPFHEYRTGPSILAEILNGKTPAKPPPNNGSWTEWGLDEDIWFKLEECWTRDPTRRPDIQQISQWLGSQKVEENRPESPSFTLFPRQSSKDRARSLSHILRDVDGMLRHMNIE